MVHVYSIWKWEAGSKGVGEGRGKTSPFNGTFQNQWLSIFFRESDEGRKNKNSYKNMFGKIKSMENYLSAQQKVGHSERLPSKGENWPLRLINILIPYAKKDLSAWVTDWSPYLVLQKMSSYPRQLCLWWVYCFHIVCPSVRVCVRPSVTFCFLNILKSHSWIFIKPCKHVHICKTNTLDKKVRARGQFY